MGSWKIRFNRDWHGYSEIFAGHQSQEIEAMSGDSDGLPFQRTVSIAPYSLLIYSQIGLKSKQHDYPDRPNDSGRSSGIDLGRSNAAMKNYRITHWTKYTYSGPVQLGPHALRLRPREGYDLRIESSTLTIQPYAFLRWHRDVEGNSVAIANFKALSDQLLIESILLIEQYDQQPLNFLVEDYAVNYPFTYNLEDCLVLQPYLLANTDQFDPSLAQWLTSVWCRGETIESHALLQRINRAIHSMISYQRREEPGVQTPAQTLFKQTGSCRDLAFLFMQVAKQLGFASRFVSGYSYTTISSQDAGSTHAWAEVFLPGAGWKGFDPTRGDIVGENYIPVAVGRMPHLVPPISGSFHGKAVLQAMTVSVIVERLNT